MGRPVKHDWLERMRRDWDERALTDAEHYIYTRDQEDDVPDFDRSGMANYNQLIRPYLPFLLSGAAPRNCRVVEIGCGAGRMTQWFARAFGEVHGVDVSEQMIRLASQRLSRFSNVNLTLGDGQSLEPLPSGHFDLVFSYIVFQHIPDREIIAGYVAEAARVLREGGAFKFQVGGVVDSRRANDTWHGVTLSRAEVVAMLRDAGLELASAEGDGTQLFVISATKARAETPGTHIYPASADAVPRLLDGWGDAVDGSWRPVADRFSVRLPPSCHGGVIYLGIYLWPGDEGRREVIARIDGESNGRMETAGGGDQYLEFPFHGASGSDSVVEFELSLPLRRRAACRSVGCYHPRD